MIFSSDQIGKLFRSISLFCPGKTETAVRVIPKSPSGKNRNGCPVYSEFTRYPWFLAMPHVIQYVIVQMVYQMGAKDFSEFILTIGHFKNRRWKQAADEMLNSRWYSE